MNEINNQTQAITSQIRTVFMFAVATSIIFIIVSYHQRNEKSRSNQLSQCFDQTARNEKKKGFYLKPDPEGIVLDDVQAYRSNLLIRRNHDVSDVRIPHIELNINQSDVLVLLHIQKTGGTTFENYLVQHTDIQPPCRCGPMYGNRIKCYCWNANGQDWLFNRHAVGWMCGVHADFTELTTCVDDWYRSQDNEDRQRDYHFVTLIRDPVNRVLSEWQHVRRGATWKECRLHCDGRDATLDEVPFCFTNGNWSTATLEEFLDCPYNMAFNRQTRMLANLSLSDCYRIDSTKSKFARDEIMLQSAKDNLRKFFKFFGILEYSYECQRLFEKTFSGIKFTKRLSSKRSSLGMNYVMLSEESWNRIIELNSLDIRLYQYAKDLFFLRLKRIGIPVVTKTHESQYVNEGFTYTTVPMGAACSTGG